MTPEICLYIYIIARTDRKKKIDEIDRKSELSLTAFVQELKNYVHAMEALLADFDLYQEVKLGNMFHKFLKM